MASALKEIEAKIRSLKPEERTQLLRSLIAELDGPSDTNVERAWLEVAKKRHQEIVERKVNPVPEKQVFEKVRSRLKR
jgi:acyl-CoA reductase-like NAD-dependent aldehyde dehydrogenase